jgi:hypothetical protein
MLKFKVSWRLYPLMMLWAVLQSLWPAGRSASCRQWRSFFHACYCFRLFFLAGVLFYVEDSFLAIDGIIRNQLDLHGYLSSDSCA